MIFTRMVSTTIACVFLACLLAVAQPPTVHAETKVITTEATYTMGDGETPSLAEAQVLQRAKQIALEQAGTYVESYTKVHNLDLTTEEIQTLAGGVLEVEVLEKTRNLVGDGLRFFIKIKATVTTDKMEDLARRIRGKNIAEEYQKLQAEYARLSGELETWKQLAAKTPQGPERDAALDQIRAREQAFTAAQRKESVLFRLLVSGRALGMELDDKKALVDQLIDQISNTGHIITIGKIATFPMSESQARLAGGTVHIVKPGETLYRICRRYGVTVDKVRKWNKLTDDIVEVGQRLIIGHPDSLEKGDGIDSIISFGVTIEPIETLKELVLQGVSVHGGRVLGELVTKPLEMYLCDPDEPGQRVSRVGLTPTPGQDKDSFQTFSFVVESSCGMSGALSTKASGTEVALAKETHSNEYAVSQLADLLFVIKLAFTDGPPYVCTIHPFYTSRVLPIEPVQFDSGRIRDKRAYTNKTNTFFVLADAVNFDVTHEMARKDIEKLTAIEGRFINKGGIQAPRCTIVLPRRS